MKKLCLAGGVALNCVGNGRILREGPFDEIWIQPAAGDAGGALGVALFIWHQLLDKPRDAETRPTAARLAARPGVQRRRDPSVSRLGRSAATRESTTRRSCAIQSPTDIAERQGRRLVPGPMEFGPRALGSRSMLGDPRVPEMQTS